MRYKNFLKFVKFSIFLLFAYTVHSEYDCLLPEDPNCPWFDGEYSIIAVGCSWTYPYKYRICNNKLEIEYGEPQKDGENCNVWTEFSSYQYDFKSKPDEFDLYLLITQSESRFGLIVDDCPSTTEIIRYFKARCGVWVYCTYQIEPQIPDCQPGFQPIPDPNATEVSIGKWQSCGFVCCQRKYMVCKKELLHYGTWIQAIGIIKGKAPNSQCSGQVIYTESECLDGCY